VKRQRTSTQDKPVLDEGAFQQLLAAAHTLQQHHDRLLVKEPKADCGQSLSGEAIAENLGPAIQVVRLTPEVVAHNLPPLEPAHLAHLTYRCRTLVKQFSLTDELFWKAATVVAVTAVSTLLLGAAAHRFPPLPAGLALPSEAVQQQAPFQKAKRTVRVPAQTGSVWMKTVVTEKPAATKAAATTVRTVVAGQRPAIRVHPASAQRTIVKLDRLHSTYDSESDIVAEDTVIRSGTLSAAPRLRAKKKP
jgi:hypothetical protein